MSRSVLIVDKDPAERGASRRALEDAGYEVLEAGRGAEALQLALLNWPDAVLLDIDLPDISGWDVLEQLRSESGTDPMRVIVFSYEADELARASTQDPDVGFMRKPLDPADLVYAVRSALGFEEPVSGAEPARRNKLNEVVTESLQDGEQIKDQTDALLKVVSQFYAKCKVVLTDRRLIVLKQAWPWGYKVGETHALPGCTVLRKKERFDGSVLMIVRDREGEFCLYFSRRWREQAGAIAAAMGSSD